MTIREAIEAVDDLKHNTYTNRQKLLWLSALEGMIQKTVMGEDTAPLTEKGMDDTLSAQPPFDEMYIHYLAAKIDYHNEEFDRCNNAMAMFQSIFDKFRRSHIRARTPAGEKFRYF